VRAHGGTITVESSPRGTRFDVYLPASAGRVLALLPQATESAPERSGRALLMDDDPMVAEVAQEMLDSLGYVTHTAVCGQSAIDRLTAAERAQEPYDVVILDLTVPGGMGGKEAVPHLRAIRPDLPVLVTSGYADNTVLAEHWRHGFDGVLPKPFSVPDLRFAIDEACARRAQSRTCALEARANALAPIS